MARQERLRLPAVQAGGFMHFQAQAVAGAVEETARDAPRPYSVTYPCAAK